MLVLKGEPAPAIIISHDCAIDKSLSVAGDPNQLSQATIQTRLSKTDVIVCPIRPIPAAWDDEKLSQVANGGVLHQFGLFPHQKWPGGYADFRWLVTYRASDLATQTRVLALSDAARSFLAAQLAAFFSWRNIGGAPDIESR